MEASLFALFFALNGLSIVEGLFQDGRRDLDF